MSDFDLPKLIYALNNAGASRTELQSILTDATPEAPDNGFSIEEILLGINKPGKVRNQLKYLLQNASGAEIENYFFNKDRIVRSVNNNGLYGDALYTLNLRAGGESARGSVVLRANAGNGWWESERAFLIDDVLTFSYVDMTTGYIEVGRWDVSDAALLSTTSLTDASSPIPAFLIDDHNAGGLGIIDGRLFVMYAGHNDDSTIRRRNSTDLNPQNFGAELTSSGAEPITYSQVSSTTSGLYRVGFYRTAGNSWNYRYSGYRADRGALTESDETWDQSVKSGKIFAADEQIYGLFRNIPGRDLIRAVVTANGGESTALRYFDIVTRGDQERGLVKVDGEGRGHLGGMPYYGNLLYDMRTDPVTVLHVDDMPVFYTPPAGKVVRLTDVSDDGLEAAISVAPDVLTPTAVCQQYIVNILTGTTYYVGETRAFGGDRYADGPAFAREPHSSAKRCYRTELTGSGSRLYRIDADLDWSNQVSTLIERSDSKLYRPDSPVGANASLAVMFLEGDYADDFASPATLRYATAPSETANPSTTVISLDAPLIVEADPRGFIFRISATGTVPAGTTIPISESNTGSPFTNSLATDITAALTTGWTYNAGVLTAGSGAVFPLTVARPLATNASETETQLTLGTPSACRVVEGHTVTKIRNKASVVDFSTGGTLGSGVSRVGNEFTFTLSATAGANRTLTYAGGKTGLTVPRLAMQVTVLPTGEFADVTLNNFSPRPNASIEIRPPVVASAGTGTVWGDNQRLHYRSKLDADYIYLVDMPAGTDFTLDFARTGLASGGGSFKVKLLALYEAF